MTTLKRFENLGWRCVWNGACLTMDLGNQVFVDAIYPWETEGKVEDDPDTYIEMQVYEGEQMVDNAQVQLRDLEDWTREIKQRYASVR